jgi:hypothetical protein
VLTEDERDHWRAKFISEQKPEEICREILEKYNVNLRTSHQLRHFRDWELEQRALDEEEARQAEDERRVLLENPGWTVDDARNVIFKKAYLRATVGGDFKLGLAVVRHDLSARNHLLAMEKFYFDAALACRQQLPELRAVEADDSLSESEKTRRFIERLFGKRPAHLTPPVTREKPETSNASA